MIFFSKAYCFDHFLQQRIELERKYDNKLRSCPGPNTFINSVGGCECSTDYPFGDPNTKIGCFACNPPCDINANCIATDICECKPGFVGDGLDLCERPVPQLISVQPTQGSEKGNYPVEFMIKSPENYTVTQAFCRFGSISVQAYIFDPTTIKCIAPRSKPEITYIAASFDLQRWSNEKLIFEFQPDERTPFSLIPLFLMIPLVPLLFYLIFITQKRNNKNDYGNSDYVLPLNQWQLHSGPRQIPTETSFSEFVWNLTMTN